MWRFRIFLLVLTAAFVAAGFHSLYGQTTSEQIPVTSSKGKPVPAPIEPKPFSAEAPKKKPAFSIDFRSAEEMSEKDRLLVADAESSIAEHAGFAGFELDQTTWSYQQMVCPALPNHLFLRYMRNNGTGDVSVFSASIPRNGEGRVRVIPILRRGYSL